MQRNVTGSNFQSWSTSKYLTAGTTLHIIDMTKLHPSCIIKVTWFSVDIISPLLDAFFLHIIVVLTATGYPLHLHQYLLLEKDPVTNGYIWILMARKQCHFCWPDDNHQRNQCLVDQEIKSMISLSQWPSDKLWVSDNCWIKCERQEETGAKLTTISPREMSAQDGVAS